MSIATIVTRGYGSFGSIPDVALRGYSIGVVYESVPIGWDLCARCGFQYPEQKLRREWSGMNVCHGPSTNDCWSPRHPQEFVRAVQDTQGIKPNMRPEPDPVYIGPGDVTADDL